MLAALGRIGGRAAKGAVAKKITSRVKAKTTKVSKDKLIGRSGSSTSMSSAPGSSLFRAEEGNEILDGGAWG